VVGEVGEVVLDSGELLAIEDGARGGVTLMLDIDGTRAVLLTCDRGREGSNGEGGNDEGL